MSKDVTVVSPEDWSADVVRKYCKDNNIVYTVLENNSDPVSEYCQYMLMFVRSINAINMSVEFKRDMSNSGKVCVVIEKGGR